MMVHVYELHEGDRIILDGEEVTYLSDHRVMETLPCGCCSDWTDEFRIEFRRDNGEVDETGTDNGGYVERVKSIFE